ESHERDVCSIVFAALLAADDRHAFLHLPPRPTHVTREFKARETPRSQGVDRAERSHRQQCADASATLTYTLLVCMLGSTRGKETIAMNQRINITLPEETLTLVDRVAEKGDRSRFIDLAIKYYVEAMGKAKLKKLLKEGAIARAERDLRLAEEWFNLEEEAWRK
ncbi:MAG: ribbon-helix-helix domain-containing protein, partial [Candidatus Binatia bacterium]